MLSDASIVLSRNIDALSRGFARRVVDRHEQMDPTIGDRYGAGWRREWAAEVETRIRYLSQAVALNQSGIFTRALDWTGAAFAARGIDASDLSVSLRAMQEGVAEDLPEDVADAVTPHVQAALSSEDGNGDAECSPQQGPPRSEIGLRYLARLLDGDQKGAIGEVIGAARDGIPVRELLRDAIGPAQVEIGAMWHRGEVTIAEEHFATSTAETVLTLLQAFYPKVEPNGKRIVGAGVAGDLHGIGLRIVTEYFAIEGWQTRYLGANVPAEDLLTDIGTYPADVLGLSIGSFLNARMLGEVVRLVRRSPGCEDIKIIVGGPPFASVPELADSFDVDGVGKSAEDAVVLANKLVLDRAG